MPYVHGPGWEPASDTEEPHLVGYMLPNKGAFLQAIRYGRVYTKRVGPRGSVSVLEAAALVYRRDPATGEVRPVHRLTVHGWARDKKLPTTPRRLRPNTRLVQHIYLPDLWHFIRHAKEAGYEFPPLYRGAAGE